MSQWLENSQGGPTWGQHVYACKYLHIIMRLLKCSKILPVAFIGHVNAEGSYRAWVMIHGDFCRRRVHPLRREGWGLWPHPCSWWAPPGTGCCWFVQPLQVTAASAWTFPHPLSETHVPHSCRRSFPKNKKSASFSTTFSSDPSYISRTFSLHLPEDSFS